MPRLEIASRYGTRRVPADDFFIDLFQTAIEPGELIIAIHVPLFKAGHRWAFHELARRRGDYALVGCGMLAEFHSRTDRATSASCSFPSANTPLRARQAEQSLIGKRLDADRGGGSPGVRRRRSRPARAMSSAAGDAAASCPRSAGPPARRRS